MQNLHKAILFSLIGTALFTPVFASGKIADGAYPAIALMTLRYLSGFITVLAVILVSKVPLAELRSPKPLQHLMRAMLGAGGGITVIHAATVIPVAYATSIGLTEGVILVALAGIFLKETITLKHWLACVISMIGALIVVSQSLDLSHMSQASLTGVLSAFAGAIFIALETLFIKVLARREHALGVLLYVNGFGTLFLITMALLFLDIPDILDWDIVPYLVIGPLAIAAQFFNIKAYRLADASLLAPVNYSWIIFATLLGIFLFNEVPTLFALAGSALIVMGGLIITLSIPRNKPSRTSPE